MSDPVLAIPVLGEPDLFRQCIESIDIECRLVVIDNSPDSFTWDIVPDECHVIDMPGNIGYPAAVNLIIKSLPREPFWLIANADVTFAPGDLARLVAATDDYGWVGIKDWRVFGLTADAVERIGLWDEHFHPCYCEDADYERRATLAGVRWGFIEGETTHVGSVSLRQHEFDNARSYPRNVRYFCDKWGVPSVRAPGGYATPFDKGGAVSDSTEPTLSRLREQAWR
jgi:GT2 family glycosyltransferase